MTSAHVKTGSFGNSVVIMSEVGLISVFFSVILGDWAMTMVFILHTWSLVPLNGNLTLCV